MAPEWVGNDSDLAATWALNHSVTTAETDPRRCDHLDGEFAKIDDEWLLSDSSANAARVKPVVRAPRAPSVLAATALRTTQQEAGRLLREQHTSVGQGSYGSPAPFCRWSDDDVMDGDGGAAG